MKNKVKICCKECGSKYVVKKGRSRTKFAVRQIYKCKDCNKRFISGFGKSYPAKIIMDSITAYNLGNSPDGTSKIIRKKHKVKVPEKTIYSWVREFDEVCSYNRIRKKAARSFKPKDVIFKKIFRHLQLYKYRYHKFKSEFFINEYFRGLKNYLANISGNCPNELFNDSFRTSNIKLNIDANKIRIFKKENYACRLASLALESADTAYERHDKLQEFMLANDTCTIAAEVPVYLFLDEVITVHEPPRQKEWQTVGSINLLVIDHYTLGFKIQPADAGSQFTVYIDYDLPKSWKTRALGVLFGGMYAKWCVRQMTQGVRDHFSG